MRRTVGTGAPGDLVLRRRLRSSTRCGSPHPPYVRATWAPLERLPDERAFRPLDLVAKHVVPQAHVVSAPVDDTRPSEPAKERPGGAGPFRSGYAPRDDAREGSKKVLKSVAAPGADNEMQMRTDVGKFVDANVESPRHAPQNVAHHAIMLWQGPRTSSSMA